MGSPLYCPLCYADILVFEGGMATMHYPRRHREMKIAHFIICTQCSLVSELSPSSGRLLDLGNVTVGDLLGVNVGRARVLMFNATRLRRSES